MDILVSKVVKGDVIFMKNNFCRVISIQVSIPSKIGTRKYCILGKAMIDGKKYFKIFRQGDMCCLLINSGELKKNMLKVYK